MIIKQDKQGKISLKGQSINLDGLNTIQAQSVLLKLGYDSDLLFEVLCAFDDNGWNETELGIFGGFLYGEYKGVNQ